jgi:hypothetical protein
MPRGYVNDYGGYRDVEFATYGVTNLHPLAIVFMACMFALALMSRRSAALLAIVLVCVFMPMEQRIVIGGLDFTMLRLVMMVVWVRVLLKGEFRELALSRLDHLILMWAISASLFSVLRVGTNAIPYRLGVSFDVLSAFFLTRILVRTPKEAFGLWRYLAWSVVVLGPLMLFEAIALHNVFGIFNYAGFDEVVVRDGEARAQGPWTHPILAGTFGSVVMPVFIAIYRGRRDERLLFAVAIIAATVVTLTSGSSGPLIAWVVGAFGWSIWRFRRHMRRMLWVAVFMAIVIHFVREKPVWHLILRISQIMGGTGYHRYYLIDAFITRFSEWALIGTDNIANWGYGLQDATCQYVTQGIGGGIVTLILFLLMLRTCFVQLRLSREMLERRTGAKSLWSLLAWGSWVSLAAHCAAFVGVAYFGQMLLFFFLFVGTVPAFAGFRHRRKVRPPARRLSSTAPPDPRFVAG